MSALDALPHGPEFRFVDSLVELDGGKSARGRYTVRGDEAFLAGHFPGNPVMPGVILVEAIAQLGGVAAQSDPEQAEVEGLLLTGIRGAKILGAAVPGEVLEISAVVEGRLGPMIQVAGEVKVGDRVLATAKVQLAGRTPP
ncbi:3-hydroxyacyl-[acyl-carrier-protein] dehydratase [Haloferula luteola]|uniref:3-hydroxyacyl-[acyl-carrier-protein] dehydratase n=1 Tax=Haloferula luteola TaxID=595692 RepID=A0A840V093_9BACT|nr:3-hydroxyacyl-ACP dehydratase FabZ family protein [Haloferula luteola]MBB5351415.1 3-hydroxyacyl-[acyl-carrier-protein] dehydratase [Haloferula luteola]